jgi:hypothetical protein
MAYSVELKRKCDSEGCPRTAKFAVYAYRNESFGIFCQRHADQRVAELTVAEENNPQGFR